MSNVSIFRKHLQEVDLYMEEVQNGDNGVFFRTTQRIEGGSSVLLVVAFDSSEEVIDLNIFNIASIKNPLKKEPLHSLLNELNYGYRYSKFSESDGEVMVQYSFKVKQNQIDPAEVLSDLIMILRSVEDEYSKFMRLQWG